MPAWAETPLRRRLAAVAFLDVVGFAHWVGADEDATLREWSALQRRVIEPLAANWGGRVANRSGDGLFLEFSSALDAFRWAVGVQAAIAACSFAAVPLRVRIALHLGDVIDDTDGQVLGDGVNTAARLQSYAEPGGVILSHAIADEVRGKTGAEFCDLGLLHLRNIARPVRAFHLSPGANDAALAAANIEAPPRAQRHLRHPAPRRWVTRAGFGVGVAALALAVGLVLSTPREPAAEIRPPLHAAAPREEAIRLTDEGQAIPCTEHPCARAWLGSRVLYERAIATDAEYGPPYALAALTYTRFIANGLSTDEAGDLRAAQRLAAQATTLSPDSAVAHYARGAVLAMQPDHLEAALAAYQRSLALDPHEAATRANVGWLLILLGRAAEAEGFIAQALAEAPNHLYAPGWLTNLGLAELFLDHPGHGAAQFRQAIAQQSSAAANGEIALQRSLDLAAALALDGELDAARQITGGLLRDNPALSTNAAWGCDCSRDPGYVAGRHALKRGMVLAGIPGPP